MHPEALEWVARYATAEPVTVLDIGGRYINGTPRDLFPNAEYRVLDLQHGSNVDIVADAATWDPPTAWDVVVCCEVFEHTDVWPQICATAFKACEPGGFLVVTCAGPGRAPHSGIDGMHVRDGEYYGNVEPADLERVLTDCGWNDVLVDQYGTDVRAHATRRG